MPLYRYAVSESASDSTTSSSENEPFSDDEQTGSTFIHHATQPAAPSTCGTSRVRAAPRLGYSQLYTHYIPPTTSREKLPVRSRKILRLRAAILDGLLALLGLLAELNEDDVTGGQWVRPATLRPRRTRKGQGVHLRLGGGSKQASHEPWSALATALDCLCSIIRSQGRVLDDQPSRTCLTVLLSLFRSVRADLGKVAARESRFHRVQWETSTAGHVDVVLGAPPIVASRVAFFALIDYVDDTLDLSSLDHLPEDVDWEGLFTAFGTTTRAVLHINASGGSFEHWPDYQPWPFPLLRSIVLLPNASLKSLPLRLAWLPISVRRPDISKPSGSSSFHFHRVSNEQTPNSTSLQLRDTRDSRPHHLRSKGPTSHGLGPPSLLDIVSEMIILRKSFFREALASLDSGLGSAFDVVAKGYVCCVCDTLCRPDGRGRAAMWLEGEYGFVLHPEDNDDIAPGLPAHDLEMRGRVCSDCRTVDVDLVGPLPPP